MCKIKSFSRILIFQGFVSAGSRHAESCAEPTATNCFSFLSLSYSHLLPASSESDTAGTEEEQSAVKELHMNWCGVSLPVSAQTVEELSGLMLTARPRLLSKPIRLSAANKTSETRDRKCWRTPVDSGRVVPPQNISRHLEMSEYHCIR